MARTTKRELEGATPRERELVERFLGRCKIKDRERLTAPVLDEVRALLLKYDPSIVDEGIGKIELADVEPQTAGYLRTTVANWAAVRGVA